MVSNEAKKNVELWNLQISEEKSETSFCSLYFTIHSPNFTTIWPGWTATSLSCHMAGRLTGWPTFRILSSSKGLRGIWMDRLPKHAKPIQNPRVFLVSRFNRFLEVFGRSLLTLARLTHETRPEGHHTVPVAAACVTPAEGAWQFWPVGCLKMVDSPKKLFNEKNDDSRRTSWGTLF